MRVIAFCQVYNEALFIKRALHWIYPLVDGIILTEGCLTPFSDQPYQSQDGTRDLIDSFLNAHDPQRKIRYLPACLPKLQPKDREAYEGCNKNMMLQHALSQHMLEPGDLIFIHDVDEFWHPDRFMAIVNKFRRKDKLEHVPVEEYQFAYNLEFCFDAEHNGRFMRYVNGARFGNTNHFIYPDGRDITKDYGYLAKRADTQMMHLCWCKPPWFIRQKVESFQRPSFTMWYNNVYLIFPLAPLRAYQNNARIPPYFGTGFAEGQHKGLVEFQGQCPSILDGLQINWLDYIRDKIEELRI